MSEKLTIGFLPLVDACLPILAHEHGFAEEEGLALDFQRDVSWATVLDRLLYGHSDAAHLIAPLAIATTLGRGRPAQPLATPFVLGLNGNAITISSDLAAKVGEPGKLADPVALGAALAEEARVRKAEGRLLRLGVVHRYSSHNYMLRYWLAASGIRPVLDLAVRRFNAFARLQAELDDAKGKLAERETIDKAKRILMQSKGVSEPEAYAELRRKAMSSSRRIIDIAEAVVTAHELMGNTE